MEPIFSGQYYYNARWYIAELYESTVHIILPNNAKLKELDSSNIGRFTTEDPIRDGLNWYAYANNNPLVYVDPTGLDAFHTGKNKCWSHDAPQYKWPKYTDNLDKWDNLIGFDIHATKFQLKKYDVRLWKGDYTKFGKFDYPWGSGGEIGLYGKDGKSLSVEKLKDLGIKSTTMNLYDKKSGELIAGWTEGSGGKDPSGWTTAFNSKKDLNKEDVYTDNIIEFKNSDLSIDFYNQASKKTKAAIGYPQNKGVPINVLPIDQDNPNVVTIRWGVNEE
ncbi:MAG: RHS repeat-associated core domain-containing protein [Spirochaetales bacterium]|nr:RHS repeat-associated core domain-containing protein [Spirochaetales bacterium]